MNTFDPIQVWISSVNQSHSNSESTKSAYIRWLNHFLDYIGKTANEVVDEYEASTSDKDFRRKYARYIRGHIAEMTNIGYAPNTINASTMAIRSFFKYSDLPLGFVPVGKIRVKYHNRDITKEEVAKVVAASRPREKAFFLMSAQSGLRPITLCMLKLKHLSPDFENGTLPCKIEVPQEIAKGKYRGYFTFMGVESVKALKAYLSTRKNLNPESYVFTSRKKPSVRTGVELDPKSVSIRFNKIVRKLRDAGQLEFKISEDGKPSQLRLYNLRKFFRKFANQAGFEFVQYWMGHIVSAGVEEHYRPTDVEFHRKLYAEKAMPFLTIDSATPNEALDEITKLKEQIAERDQRIEELEKKQKDYDSKYEAVKQMAEEVQSIYAALKHFKTGDVEVATTVDMPPKAMKEIAEDVRKKSKKK